MAQKVEIGLKVTGNAGAEYKKNARAITQANKKIVASSKAVEAQTVKSSKAITSAISAQKAVVVGLAGLLTGKVTQSFITTQKNIDRINNALKVGTGGTKAAAVEFAFLETQSKRLGLELQSTALSYAQLTAAAKNTNLTAKDQRDIFIGVSEAGAALGLSADDMAGALRAVQQMISKGNVQAEELRGQLGERIPGAFSLAAKAMGLTEKALNKQLELGNVLAEDMLPKLAKELSATFGATAALGPETLNGKINALKNTVFDFQREILEGGGADFLKASFEIAAKSVKVLGANISVLTGLAKSLFLVWSGKQILSIASALERNFQATKNSTVALGEYRTKTVTATRAQWGFNRSVKALSFIGPLLAIAAFQFAIDKLLKTMDKAADRKGGKEDFLMTPESVEKVRKSAIIINELRDEVAKFEKQRVTTIDRSGKFDLGITAKQEAKFQKFKTAVRDFQKEAGTGFDISRVSDNFIKGLDAIEKKLTTVNKKIKKVTAPTKAAFKKPTGLVGIPGITKRSFTQIDGEKELDELMTHGRAVAAFQKERADQQAQIFAASEELKINRMKEGSDKELALIENQFILERQLRSDNNSELELLDLEHQGIIEQQQKDAAEKRKDLIIQTSNVILSGTGALTSSLGNLAAVQGQNELKAAEDRGAAESEIDAIRKKSFEKQKDFSLKSAFISLAQAALAGYTQVPFFPVGAAAGSLALLAGGVQINAIKAQNFAHGGIVGGSSFSGDNVPINANSGELIANRAQQKRLLNAMDGKGGGGSRTINFEAPILNFYGGDPGENARKVGDTYQEMLNNFAETERDSSVHELV